jgi:hypothetical protein
MELIRSFNCNKNKSLLRPARAVWSRNDGANGAESPGSPTEAGVECSQNNQLPAPGDVTIQNAGYIINYRSLYHCGLVFDRL